jgi:hypothetical protein
MKSHKCRPGIYLAIYITIKHDKDDHIIFGNMRLTYLRAYVAVIALSGGR